MGAVERQKKLNARLFELKMSQKTLAEKANMNPGYISMIVVGRMNALPGEKERIAEVLEMSVTELFDA